MALKKAEGGTPKRMRPATADDIDWDAIRADYEIGVKPLTEIAAEHRLTFQKITGRAKKQLWPSRAVVKHDAAPPAMPDDAEALAARLTKLIAREIADIERQVRTTRDGAEGERQARRLASLVRSIDKLHEIEKTARQAKKNDPASDKAKRRAEDERLRIELDQRLARTFAAIDQGQLREEADTAGSALPR